MDILDFNQEMDLLKVMFPEEYLLNIELLKIICHISDDTKKQCKMDNAKITTFLTTDTVIKMAELIFDGFSIKEIVVSSFFV